MLRVFLPSLPLLLGTSAESHRRHRPWLTFLHHYQSPFSRSAGKHWLSCLRSAKERRGSPSESLPLPLPLPAITAAMIPCPEILGIEDRGGSAQCSEDSVSPARLPSHALCHSRFRLQISKRSPAPTVQRAVSTRTSSLSAARRWRREGQSKLCFTRFLLASSFLPKALRHLICDNGPLCCCFSPFCAGRNSRAGHNSGRETQALPSVPEIRLHGKEGVGAC